MVTLRLIIEFPPDLIKEFGKSTDIALLKLEGLLKPLDFEFFGWMNDGGLSFWKDTEDDRKDYVDLTRVFGVSNFARIRNYTMVPED